MLSPGASSRGQRCTRSIPFARTVPRWRTGQFSSTRGGGQLPSSVRPQPFICSGHSCLAFHSLCPAVCTPLSSQRTTGGAGRYSHQLLKPSKGGAVSPDYFPPHFWFNSSGARTERNRSPKLCSSLPAPRERGWLMDGLACPVGARRPQRHRVRRLGPFSSGTWARPRSPPEVCLSEPGEGPVTITGQGGGGLAAPPRPVQPSRRSAAKAFHAFRDRPPSLVRRSGTNWDPPVRWGTEQGLEPGSPLPAQQTFRAGRARVERGPRSSRLDTPPRRLGPPALGHRTRPGLGVARPPSQPRAILER